MGFCSNCWPFPFLCNNYSNDDGETTKLALMGKSESNHPKTNSKMLALEPEDQGKLETMEKEGMRMLSNDNHLQWKNKAYLC